VLDDRDELCALIPHAGSMCLLDRVTSWDATQICCATGSHRRPGNPLRNEAGLSSLNGIEYGAQAIAVHGGLLARQQGATVAPGYLASLRNVELQVDWLHDIASPLRVEAHCLQGDRHHFIYEFRVFAEAQLLLAGRATILVPRSA